MKRTIFTKLGLLSLLVALIAFDGFAQEEKPSPARTEEGKVAGANIKINYSSPAVKGRQIWGNLVPLGEVWRAGANEATTFETDKNINVQGKNLPKGKYSLFVIPNENESVLIFNKVADQWGSGDYDESEDALRVNVPSGQSQTLEERLTYELQDDGLELRWEYGKTFVKID